jgi:prepilin-type N-terminal cleavage/methylation domain-containing protein
LREHRIKLLSARRGFTLIELIVAMAIFIIITVFAFSLLSSFFRLKTAFEQEMVIQRNFRVAVDRITEDFRQAAAAPGSGHSIVIKPDDKSIDSTLQFYMVDSDKEPPEEYKVTYKLEKPNGSDCYYVTKNDQPITEELPQFVKMYFIRSSGKICILLIGKADYFGKKHDIVFTSIIYSRNSPYEKP